MELRNNKRQMESLPPAKGSLSQRNQNGQIPLIPKPHLKRSERKKWSERVKRSSMTPEELDLARRINRIQRAHSRANMDPEMRAERRERDKLRKQFIRAGMSKKKKSEEREKDRVRKAIKRASMDPKNRKKIRKIEKI
eukprot:TRINITY_DN5106_c0_g1_i1.p1 TRINITY_DN5106_c0_g1~~TRINITY_DN5106_c0_g1_i1.p1  ORF type:complete len:138 (+),score=22.36 TRINITY_DN5106_c0_g1_i1:74-487(+)